MLSLVPVVALLLSDSTSPLLCYVACTIRKNACVNFWGGTTAIKTTDVYLTVTLQFYDRHLRDNGGRSYTAVCDTPAPVQAWDALPAFGGTRTYCCNENVVTACMCWLDFCPDKRYEYEY